MNKAVAGILIIGLVLCGGRAHGVDDETQAEREHQNVRVKVVAVNPSQNKNQQVPVKIYLPQEVTPEDIVSKGELVLGYDSQKSTYYVYKNDVELKPKESRVFEVEVKDVWFVPQGQIDDFRKHSRLVLSRLKGSTYYETAQGLATSIDESLNKVYATQNDETASRKERIGRYRSNLLLVEAVEKNINRMEKLITIAQSRPVPEVLEKPKVKTESPTKTTTWMIIFIIMLFIGMLAGVFFFTWQTQAHYTKDFIVGVRKLVFGKGGTPPATPEKTEPGSPEGEEPKPEA
jgi:hypothetical protein